MTELDLELGPLALELVNEFGKQISYQATSTGEYDIETATFNTVGDPVIIKAIVEDYDLQTGGQAFASGLIEQGDKKVTVPARALEALPTTGDILNIDGINYTVANVKVVYSGELAALYVLQGRRS